VANLNKPVKVIFSAGCNIAGPPPAAPAVEPAPGLVKVPMDEPASANPATPVDYVPPLKKARLNKPDLMQSKITSRVRTCILRFGTPPELETVEGSRF